MTKILPLSLVDKEDIHFVGSKAANLGELIRANLPVPSGFVITTQAYQEVSEFYNLNGQIKQVFAQLHPDQPEQILKASARINSLFSKVTLPKTLEREILEAVKTLFRGKSSKMAVRSSAIFEDIRGLSFAGEFTSFLNVSSGDLKERIKDCWMSQFSPKAIAYAYARGVDLAKSAIAVIVQNLVEVEVSGSAMTANPVSGSKNEVIIEAIRGFGPPASSGQVIPDRYFVNKESLSLVSKIYGKQEVQMIKVGEKTKEVPISRAHRGDQKLSDADIIKLAKLAKRIEEHFYFSQNIEWAFSEGKLFIIQSRSVDIFKKEIEREHIGQQNLVLSGAAASKGIGWGRAHIVKKISDLKKFADGEVIITPTTSPDFILGMKRAAAIVTDQGGLTSHAAILARELGRPCVVGTGAATSTLRNGQFVTVNGASGQVFLGRPKFPRKPFSSYSQRVESKPNHRLKQMKTATKVYYCADDLQELVRGLGIRSDGIFIKNFSEWSPDDFENLSKISYGRNLILGCESNFLDTKPIGLASVNFKGLTIGISGVKSSEEIAQVAKNIRHPVFLILDLPIHLLTFEDFLKTDGIKGLIIDVESLISNSLGQGRENELLVFKHLAGSHFLSKAYDLIWKAKKANKQVLIFFNKSFTWDLLELAITLGVWGIIVPRSQISQVREILYELERGLVKKSKLETKEDEFLWQRSLKS